MKIATCTLQSVSPYSPSRSFSMETPKEAKESHEAYEERTWREKAHATKSGEVFIPPMAFKMGVDTAAKMISRRIPGKGQSTYTKFFKSGVLCMDPVMLGVQKDETECDRIFANADGVRGSGKRVWRLFPRVDEWKAEVVFHVLADEITKDIFEEHLAQAGAFVGVGRFRPENGGFYGRYAVKKVAWS